MLRPSDRRGRRARRHLLAPLAVAALTGAAAAGDPAQDALRVCADPNNLPFSNARGEGFENQLAELVASDLGKPVAYTWWAQRRGFIRTP